MGPSLIRRFTVVFYYMVNRDSRPSLIFKTCMLRRYGMCYFAFTLEILGLLPIEFCLFRADVHNGLYTRGCIPGAAYQVAVLTELVSGVPSDL